MDGEFYKREMYPLLEVHAITHLPPFL